MQFDVCENRLARSRARVPYLLILQNDFLGNSANCVVAPLVKASEIDAVARLNPSFVVARQQVFLSILEIASVRRSGLGKTVANLDSKRDKIIAAIDLLFTGF